MNGAQIRQPEFVTEPGTLAGLFPSLTRPLGPWGAPRFAAEAEGSQARLARDRIDSTVFGESVFAR
jgi:hypothetical protein